MMVSFRNLQRLHCVGIGGIGMSGIAEVVLTLGYSVSGSDTKPSTITERLQNLGATVYEGHKASNADGAHVVVTSSAVKADNPEVVEAHKMKIPVIPRAEMLAELMRLKYGIAVAGAHGKTITSVKRPIITYGTSSQADLVISDVKLEGLGSEFRLTYKGEDLGLFKLAHPPGMHNVRNAAAAAAVALYLNVPADLIREGLIKFAGVGRRFDIKRVVNGITVVDDYGHHPAHMRATLEAARGCKFNRLLVLFQPHRYTRTQHLWDEFCRAFNQADILVLLDIYAASEAPIPGATSEALAGAVREAGHKNGHYFRSMPE